MASVKFITRKKSELSTVYVRVQHKRFLDLTASTDLVINSKYWDQKNQKVKKIAEFRDSLNFSNRISSLKTFLEEKLLIAINEGKEIHVNWLKNELDLFYNRTKKEDSSSLIFRFRKHIQELQERIKPVSPNTIKGIKTTIKRFEKFEEHTGDKIYIQDIDLTFHDNYTAFATKILNLSVNSYGQDIKRLKTLLNDLSSKGVKVSTQVNSRKFKSVSESKEVVSLSEIELKAIKNFKGTESLENARDWLIVGCYTGCRISDLLELKTGDIGQNTRGQKYIQYIQNKTKKTVVVPIHQNVTEILTRLNGFPKVISDVKLNKYIKEVCKESGVTQIIHGSKTDSETKRKSVGMFPKHELITTHCFRRTFATIHYGTFPNKLIMEVTGHSTEKQLLAYIGKQDDSHLDRFYDHWEKEEKENDNIKPLFKNS